MTMTEEREAKLAALQADDPPPAPEPESSGLTELQSQLSALRTSVEQLSAAQNSTTAAVNTLITASAIPKDDGSMNRLTELDARVVSVASSVEELVGKVTEVADKPVPQPPSATSLSSASRKELATEVTAGVAEYLLPRIESSHRQAVSAMASSPTVSKAVGRAADPARTVTADLRDAVAVMEKAQRTARVAMNWAYAYRMGVLMVPYVVALTILAAFIVPVAEITGVGPLSRWAWTSFEAADSWGTRSWIALATLAAVGGLIYAVYRGGKALVESYKAYHQHMK